MTKTVWGGVLGDGGSKNEKNTTKKTSDKQQMFINSNLILNPNC